MGTCSSMRRRMMMQGKVTPPILDGHEYVDLALPSGTLWATMNIGSDKASDVGLYFRWAEVIGYATGNTTSYKYGTNNNKTMTKYNATDGLTTLELSDDAVNANWGGGWGMPTRAQLNELVNTSNTTKTTVNNYMGSGINGNLYTSKRNGKSIFFPYSGEYVGTSKYNATKVYTWTSSLNSSNVKQAYCTGDNATSTKVEIRIYFLTARGVYNR